MKLLKNAISFIRRSIQDFIDFDNKKYEERRRKYFPPEPAVQEERSKTLPSAPEITVFFVIDLKTDQKVYCWYEPKWFSFNLGNEYVTAVNKENIALLQTRGFLDNTCFKMEWQSFDSDKAFFEKYPEWKDRASCFRDKVVRLWEADQPAVSS